MALCGLYHSGSQPFIVALPSPWYVVIHWTKMLLQIFFCFPPPQLWGSCCLTCRPSSPSTSSPGWRHSPPSLLLLPLPHLPHSLWLLSRLWPQSPGHSLKTIIPPGTRPRLHTGISPYTTVLYKGLAYTQYTHFLWVVLCVWLCTNTTEWLSHTFTVSENTPFFTGVFSWSYCLG